MRSLLIASRLVFKQRMLAAVVIATLALGIGTTVLMFSIVNGVLLQPLPFPRAGQLVSVGESSLGWREGLVASHTYLTWRERSQSFEHLAVMHRTDRSIEGFGDPLVVQAAHVSANFFDALGVRPVLGRPFDRSTDDTPIVLSDQLWKRLGADRQILGKTLRIVGRPYVVVGVMPPMQVSGPFIGLGDYWTWSITDQVNQENRPGSYRGRYVIGRLKPGVSVEQARTELAAIQRQLEAEYPQFYSKVGVTVAPLREAVVGGVRPALTILFASATFLLLIACANVANLLLARSVARQKEVAIRLALGASRWQIVRQFLTESLVLSTIGGVLGVVCVRLGLSLFVRLSAASVPRAESIVVDMRVLLFAVAVALVTGMLFGIAPALAGARGDVAAATREGARGASSGPGSRRLRQILVSAEVALSIVLLAASGLLLRSFWNLADVDLGFRPAQVLTGELRILDLTYPEEGGARKALLGRLMSRLGSLPGVTHVGASYYFPLRERQMTHYIIVDGRQHVPGQEPAVENTGVIGDYLQAMGIPLIQGRWWTAEEMWDRPGSVIVSASMARMLWPNQDPIGKRLTHDRAAGPQWMTVIGVVGDVRQRSVDAPPLPQWYFPYSTFSSTVMTVAIQTTGDPASLAAGARRAVSEVDPNLPLHRLVTLEDLVDSTTSERKLAFALLGGFAAMALLLASMGVYATVANAVAQRHREIAIRVAVGATQEAVVRLMMRDGLAMVAIGCVAGVVVGLVATRLMRSLLFGVSPVDALSFASAVLILGLVTCAACYFPARKAAAVDPAATLVA